MPPGPSGADPTATPTGTATATAATEADADAATMATAAAAAAAAARPAMVSLPRLLSTCADAARRGCLVIRAVQAGREGGRNGEGGSSSLGVRYKVGGDPRSALTEADGAAQRVVLACLRGRWGDGLAIVGEEDEDEDEGGGEGDGSGDPFAAYAVPAPAAFPLREDLAHPPGGAGGWEVPLSSVCVYVDPMDGTREFVEGRLGNVQCLVGIAVGGRAVGGAVGLPFPGGRTNGGEDVAEAEAEAEGEGGGEGPVQVVYGLAPGGGGGAVLGRVAVEEDAGEGGDGGSGGIFVPLPFFPSSPVPSPPLDAGPPRLTVLTGDSRRPEKDLALSVLRDLCGEDGVAMDVRTAGGSGNKMHRVALAAGAGAGDGADVIAVAPRGTCSWDTAAPTGVLLAALAAGRGRPGLVSDLAARDLRYDRGGGDVTNGAGVLASCGDRAERYHRELCRRLLKRGIEEMID
jgi:3'-phosphoadenosine 5'-phosphosulfate (PAPS) 3'-phosphatase